MTTVASLRVLLLALAVPLAACGGTAHPRSDAGTDSGAALDAGPSVEDGGPDTAVVDAGTDAPADTGGDDGGCAAGLSPCPVDGGGVQCVDLGADNCNCRQCGRLCACRDGDCEECPLPLWPCPLPGMCTPGPGSDCFDLRNDPEDCGACWHVCAAGEVCISGACEPP